jgi:serine/threonine-protein kinase
MREGAQVGAYRVLGQIGQGGMGSVWLAEHVALGRRAALKVLHPEYSSNAEIVQRFFNEARAATSIQDPGIVQIFDFGKDADGSAFIVMELLDGEPLDRRLKRQGALPVEDALRIMRQVASSLGAAHTRGIIHRDLKPENIFMARDPEVMGGERAKILDFGIAKLVGDNTGMKTQTSAVMGTPTYMSPEQCRGAGRVDQRSDVYALGCVLFALLTGRPPFVADGMGEIIAMHLREPAPAPSLLREGIAAELDQLVLKCLAKDVAHRYSSASELAVALGTLLGSAPRYETAPVPAISAAPTLASTPTTLSSAAGVSNVAVPGRSRWPLIAGVSVVVAATVAIAVIASGSSNKPSVASNEPTGSASTASGSTESAATGSAAMGSAAITPMPPPQPTVIIDAPSDSKSLVKSQIVDVLSKFAAWSRDNAGAPCPAAAALGATRNDAWGHPLTITCTDQPATQMIGVISTGPDGLPGTEDDVASWQLDGDVTAIVRGSHWQPSGPPAIAASTPTTKAGTATKSTTSRKTRTHAKPADSPTPAKQGAKIELDENGMPVSR